MRAATVTACGSLPGISAVRGDLHFEIRGSHEQPAVALLEQHVSENRQRMAPFDDAGDGLQRFQQRIPGNIL